METCRNGTLEEYRELVKKWKDYIEKEVILEPDLLYEFLSILVLNLYTAKNKKEVVYKGVIFHGSPGTGKTLLMKKTEEVLKKYMEEDYKIVKISGPEIISEYYGKTERNLRNRFLEANEIGERFGLGIIYIDELDSIAPKRDMVKGDLEPRLVGQLLSLMDGLESYRVFIVASTNRLNAIDSALRRPGRFDKELEFKLPNKELRKEIIKLYVNKFSEKLGLNNYKLDIDELVVKTEGFSPAEIMHLIREIYREIFTEGKLNKNLEEFIKRIKSKN